MTRRRGDWALTGLLLAISYLPLLLTKPGLVAADTKQYLYLDPTRMTTGAASMWDPNTGLGTVTHQNIGYLFPMGPYYSLVHWMGLPTWIGQRIWMGSLLFFAGWGVAFCARQLGLEGPGRVVASVAYVLTPYTLVYLDRISAILMPWAALGWLVGLTVRAARTGRWRHPALFAVVVALVGGVNATSVVLVLVAPALWLGYAVWATREVTGRRAAATAGRIAGLSVLVSVWWAAGLWVESRYGINVLRVTETVPTVSRTSSAAEALRGLGYWYFYGWDKVQPWTLPAISYTQSLWLVALSFFLPAACLALGYLARWAYRGFALALVGVGTVVAVGAYPYAHPSLLGAVIKGGSTGSVALALRSVDRVVPVVVLGLALMLGSGVAAVAWRRPRLGLLVGTTCLALTAANLPALWTGRAIASNLVRSAGLPGYWTQATDYLNAQGDGSRVLGLPGEDFAAYSWGVTIDPVAPGLLDRPYVGRQITPAGTPPAANLLQALDEPLQEGTLDPAALAPLARLMSVGQVLLQSDLQYERYHLPLPQYLWQELTPVPAGLVGPKAFGAPNPAAPIRYPLDSELRLGLPPADPQPPALAVFDVDQPRPLVRAEPAAGSLLVAGDGTGLVEAADAGLLTGEGSQPIFYSAGLGQDPSAWSQAVSPGSALVLTDSNPAATYRWGSLRDDIGQVEGPGGGDLTANPSDYALPVFPGETQADQTVAQLSGVASVRASGYGDPFTFTPEDRPVNAVDGDPGTAWTYGAHEPVSGGRLRIDLLHAVTADHIQLTQAQLEPPNRWITDVTLLFDGGHPVHARLTPASFSPPGQTISFPGRTFDRLEVVVDGATGGAHHRYDGLPPVGLAEVGIPGLASVAESLRLPTDLLTALGSSSVAHPLAILMQRQRAIEPPRHDPELKLSRTFLLPTGRTFSVGGTAEIDAGDSDYLINQLVGLTPPPRAARTPTALAVVVAANSSTRLVGDRQARANAAVDGNPATAWIAETGPQSGEWVRYTLDRPISFDQLDLQVITDGRHSLPTRLTIGSGSTTRTVAIPQLPVGDGRAQGSTSKVRLKFPAITGTTFTFTIDAVHPVRALDYYSTFAGTTDILPVGIAEFGIPGVQQPATPAALPAPCRSDLIRIDGRPVDVAVTGSSAAALGGRQLELQPCGNSVGGVYLSAGSHVVQTSPRLPSGWSVDQLWLESGAGGGPGLADPAPPGPMPPVRVDHQDRTSLTVTVDGSGSPFWLVLGQSVSSGWTATIAGGRSLGRPRLIDGYANGWYVPAGAVPGPTVIHLQWTPQKVVWVALAVSAASLLASSLIAVWPERWSPWRRRRRRLFRAPARSSPELARRPGRSEWRQPGVRATVMVAVAWGAVSAAASRPLIGGAGAVAVALGCRWARGRLAARLCGLGAMALLPAYAVWQQATHHYWPDINWPAELSAANDLAWLGLVLLGSDLVAGWAGRPRPAATSVP